ncbi:MAG: hypothetical protein DID90_2727553110 [Candidatus Nitrotoga sp. LAW]|nr:MAG: hypothetical protein DID90_2727553110 [Candidatus Nitrotoga sp. LAW]
MKSDQLHDLWTSPDNSRLTTKQFSFRLPVHIAAKIAALCEVYPQKNRTQIVADLLTTAIDELEKRLPECPGEPVDDRDNDYIAHQIGEKGQLYYMGGIRGRFQRSADSHYCLLEKELGNEHPEALYGNFVGTKDQFKTSSK